MAPTERDCVLLTGAAGFIGSHLAAALLGQGHTVVGVDNFDPYYPRAAKEENLQPLRGHVGFRFIECDITNKAAIDQAIRQGGVTSIIHLAAKAGVRPSIADPAGYARVNVFGTSVILESANQAGCRRVVVASSSSVYGNAPTAPFGEQMDVNEPISPYAATKRASELMGHTHWKLTRMPVAMLRFFTVYGPRQRPDLAIALFMRKIALGEPIEMFGDGSMSRDFTYIDDIVAGVLEAHERIDTHGYRVWNLGSDRPVHLADMIAAIGRVVGREPIIQRKAVQPGDVDRTWADLTRSRAELGYQPSTSFEDGLARQWAWMRPRLG